MIDSKHEDGNNIIQDKKISLLCILFHIIKSYLEKTIHSFKNNISY